MEAGIFFLSPQVAHFGLDGTVAHRRGNRDEALGWLEAHRAEPGTSVITSLPDLSELPDLDFDGWRAWFIDADSPCLDDAIQEAFDNDYAAVLVSPDGSTKILLPDAATRQAS